MKYTNANDIPKFTRHPGYACDVQWVDVARHLWQWNADLNPDFQRGHVWTQAQQVAFVEFCLRGGTSGRNVYLNGPRFHRGLVLVDGKQRVEAWRKFASGEFPVFGDTYFGDFTTPLMDHCVTARLHVNDLQTRAEVLTWYLEMNGGGTPHTAEELARVAALLKETQS